MNVGKNKVMKCSRNIGVERINVRLNGKQVEEMDSYKDVGSTFILDRGIDTEVKYRMKEARKMLGGLRRF